MTEAQMLAAVMCHQRRDVRWWTDAIPGHLSVPSRPLGGTSDLSYVRGVEVRSVFTTETQGLPYFFFSPNPWLLFLIPLQLHRNLTNMSGNQGDLGALKGGIATGEVEDEGVLEITQEVPIH